MVKCAVPTCDHSTDGEYDHLWFFPFPKNPVERRKWLGLTMAVSVDDSIEEDKPLVVCSIHFRGDDLKVTLKKGRLPCRYLDGIPVETVLEETAEEAEEVVFDELPPDCFESGMESETGVMDGVYEAEEQQEVIEIDEVWDVGFKELKPHVKSVEMQKLISKVMDCPECKKSCSTDPEAENFIYKHFYEEHPLDMDDDRLPECWICHKRYAQIKCHVFHQHLNIKFCNNKKQEDLAKLHMSGEKILEKEELLKEFQLTPFDVVACKVCGNHYTIRHGLSLWTHLKLNHPNADPLWCWICEKSIPGRPGVPDPLEIHFRCHMEGKTVDSTEKTQPLIVKCPECGVPHSADPNKPDSIYRHLFEFHPLQLSSGELPRCWFCQREFKDLKFHVFHQHLNMAYTNSEEQRKLAKLHMSGEKVLTKEEIMHEFQLTPFDVVQCTLCHNYYSTKHGISLWHHLKTQHPNDDPLWCWICEKRITGKLHARDPLAAHFRSHLGGRKVDLESTMKHPRVCHCCGEKVEGRMSAHMKEAHYDSSSLCTICGESTSDTKDHFNKKHRTRKCKVCNEDVLAVRFYAHMQKHSTDKVVCTICGSSMKHRSMYEHMRKHRGHRHKCKDCGKEYKDTGGLMKHRKTHHTKEGMPRKYLCTYCPFASKTTNGLKGHINRHLGLKPFKCEFCDYRSGQESNVRQHVYSQHKIRRSECPDCGAVVLKRNFTLHRKKYCKKGRLRTAVKPEIKSEEFVEESVPLPLEQDLQ